MNRQNIQPEGLAPPGPPYTPVVVSGDLVYTSGQAPFDAEGKLVSEDFAEQTHQVLRNIEICLKAAGCGFEDVLKVNAFLSDLENFATYNEIYREYFKAPYPARSTVGTDLVGIQVEIEAVARRPV